MILSLSRSAPSLLALKDSRRGNREELHLWGSSIHKRIFEVIFLKMHHMQETKTNSLAYFKTNNEFLVRGRVPPNSLLFEMWGSFSSASGSFDN